MPVENIWNELQMGKNIERPKQHEEYRAWPKSLIHTREFQKERKKKKKDIWAIVEEIMAEKFADLIRDSNPPIQEALWLPSKINKKKGTSMHMTVNILKTKRQK